MADTKEEAIEVLLPEEPEKETEPELPTEKLDTEDTEEANENGKISSKSSDISIISIEEIGPEDVVAEKVEIAIEEIGPEDVVAEKVDIAIEEIGPEDVIAEKVEIAIEEIGPEDVIVEKVENAEVLLPEEVKAEPAKEEVIEELFREPERSVSEVEEEEEDDDDDDDDFDDETILERLAGLTEMLPKGLTHCADASASGLVSGLKWAYTASRAVTWIVCTSASIMFLPIMIETERMGIEEAQKQQQRQILLGPGAAMSGGNAQVNAPLPTAMS